MESMKGQGHAPIQHHKMAAMSVQEMRRITNHVPFLTVQVTTEMIVFLYLILNSFIQWNELVFSQVSAQ